MKSYSCLPAPHFKFDAVALAEVCRRYEVKLSLFGSAARVQRRPDSGVDLLVTFSPGVRSGLINFESFAEEVESILGYRVDLATKRGHGPWVSPEVPKDARVLYAAWVVTPQRYPRRLPKDGGHSRRH